MDPLLDAPLHFSEADATQRVGGGSPTPRGRKRGRPLEMAPEAVLARIRELRSGPGLYRVHLDHPAIYARARRLFGSWSAAVLAAGLDYSESVRDARRRSVATRRNRRGEAGGDAVERGAAPRRDRDAL